MVSRRRAITEVVGVVSENSTLHLHSGNSITFYNDIWCGHLPLATSYANLFKMSRDRNDTVASMISLEESWKFDFKRVLTNSEVEEYANMLTVIGDNPPYRDGLADTRRWKLNSTGIFTVKSLYSKLVDEVGVN